jgi:hypothetical protein
MRRKTNGYLKAFAGILFAVGLLLLSNPAYAVQEVDSDKWQFSVMPYLWLPSINGDLRFSIPPGSDGPNSVEIGPNDYLGSLNFVLMLKGEARKNKWAAFTDFIYLDLSGESSSVITLSGPGGRIERPVDTGTKIGLSGLVWQLAGSYTVNDSKSANLDIIGGARYFGVKSSVDWEINAQNVTESGGLSESEDLFDVIVGVRGKFGFCENWYIPYYLDIGTGSSIVTTEGMVGIGYSFKWGDVLLAYRYLYYDQSDNKLLDNFSMSGPGLGVNFRF